MITDITQRLRSEHHNEVFSKLSHRLSSATTAAEAATIISEASDALFEWDDFALDLYSPEKDEVFSLLNITTVNNQRVEIPSSTQPKSANALVRRVINNGAELVETSGPKGHSAAAMLVPIRKAPASSVFCLSKVTCWGPTQNGTWKHCKRWPINVVALSNVFARKRRCVKVSGDSRPLRKLPDAIFVEDLNETVLDVILPLCPARVNARPVNRQKRLQ